MHEVIEQFRDAIRAAGLNPRDVIEPGRIHRFAINGRQGDDAGWCTLFADQRGGVFGDFRTGLFETWQRRIHCPCGKTLKIVSPGSEPFQRSKRADEVRA